METDGCVIIKRDSQEKDKENSQRRKKDFRKSTEQGAKQINKERRAS